MEEKKYKCKHRLSVNGIPIAHTTTKWQQPKHQFFFNDNTKDTNHPRKKNKNKTTNEFDAQANYSSTDDPSHMR